MTRMTHAYLQGAYTWYDARKAKIFSLALQPKSGVPQNWCLTFVQGALDWGQISKRRKRQQP
jgi:hypothetical protein